MKFGFCTPSITRRIAARTSWKRIARQSLGLKAPRGMGWFTNPRKAAYNRVYDRTTIDPVGLLTRRRGGSLTGAIVILLVLFLLGLALS
jgi:hypothetical protein